MDEYHKVGHATGQTNTHRKVQLTFRLVKLIRMCVFMCVCYQYHKEARDTQDLLKRLDKELDQKYNPEFKDMYQMEGLIGEIDVSITWSEQEYISNSPFLQHWKQ